MRTFTALLCSFAACAAAAFLIGCEPASSAPDPAVATPAASDDAKTIEIVNGNTFDRDGVSIAVELRAQLAKGGQGHDWFDVVLTCGGPEGTVCFGAMEESGTLGEWQPLALGAPTAVGDIAGAKVGDEAYRVRVRFTRQDGTTTDLAFVNFR